MNFSSRQTGACMCPRKAQDLADVGGYGFREDPVLYYLWPAWDSSCSGSQLRALPSATIAEVVTGLGTPPVDLP